MARFARAPHYKKKLNKSIQQQYHPKPQRGLDVYYHLIAYFGDNGMMPLSLRPWVPPQAPEQQGMREKEKGERTEEKESRKVNHTWHTHIHYIKYYLCISYLFPRTLRSLRTQQPVFTATRPVHHSAAFKSLPTLHAANTSDLSFCQYVALKTLQKFILSVRTVENTLKDFVPLQTSLF